MPRQGKFPGVKRIPRTDGGHTWFWVASQITRNSKGFQPRTRFLWRGIGGPSEADLKIIGQECALLTGNLLAWQSTGKAPKPRLVVIGTVYFIANAEGFIKIGFTTDLAQRVMTLQVGSPTELRLLGTLAASNRMDRELKHRFRALRLRGEWHRPEKALIDFIKAEATALAEAA